MTTLTWHRQETARFYVERPWLPRDRQDCWSDERGAREFLTQRRLREPGMWDDAYVVRETVTAERLP